jgi:mono/diheme cytochrome c family protein
MTGTGRFLGAALTVLCATAVSAQAQQKAACPPPDVTPAAIKDGDSIFHGPGLCMACHGQDAKGMPNMGANLTDEKWLHSKGTYDDIVKQIMTGVTAKESTTGTVMPPKGGSSITDAQVKAVAAYVWSLSHKCK